MSDIHEDLNAYLGIPDSANMPSSMAVNQDQINSANSTDGTHEARSKYYGVYTNKGKNADKFAFRAALRLGNGDNARWMNLGYFNCEHTAAIAYNVAAVNMFGKGAWLNPVDTKLCEPVEYARYKEVRAAHIVSSTKKVKEIQEAGGELRYVDLEADRTQATA